MTFDKERCKNCARNFFCEMGALFMLSDVYIFCATIHPMGK